MNALLQREGVKTMEKLFGAIIIIIIITFYQENQWYFVHSTKIRGSEMPCKLHEGERFLNDCYFIDIKIPSQLFD